MRAYFFWKSNSKSLSFGFALRRHAQAHFFDPRDRRFRTFLTMVLSILLHILVLWLLFRVIQLSQGGAAGPTVQTLNVSLADNAKKAASPTPEVAPQPTPAAAPPPEEPERIRRNIISSHAPSPLHVPAQSAQNQLNPLPPMPQSTQPPQPDMTDLLNEKRDARAAADAHERDLEANGGTGESDADKAKRVIASNLKYAKGKDYEQGGGGVFDIKEKGLHNATLIFNGWNRDLSRNFGKEIVVKQGTEPSIDSAIVAQVILIIREQYNGDFQWQSQRLGKTVTRSARKEDEAALKEFLNQEFSYIEDIDLNRRPPPDPPQRRR